MTRIYYIVMIFTLFRKKSMHYYIIIVFTLKMTYMYCIVIIFTLFGMT
jgi:hypothetical protein